MCHKINVWWLLPFCIRILDIKRYETDLQFTIFTICPCNFISQQESILVGCVPPACCPYPVVSHVSRGEDGLPTPTPDTDSPVGRPKGGSVQTPSLDADPPRMQTPMLGSLPPCPFWWSMHCPLPSVKVYIFLIRVNITNIAKIKFYTLATQSLDLMQKGTRLTKVRGKGKKYKRGFKLDEDLLSISYRGSKKWFGGDRDCKGKFSYIRMH